MGLLDGKVAVVTGAGGGLGETHALLLAKEGAAVVVNDLGGSRDGAGGGNAMADQVVDKIKAMGGQAVADYGNVANEDDANAMIQRAVDSFGKIDFLIANAGILRDKSFKNMTNDTNMYASLAKGYKQGGFNLGLGLDANLTNKNLGPCCNELRCFQKME